MKSNQRKGKLFGVNQWSKRKQSNISVTFPLECLTVVSGVSGSGKVH